MNDTFSKKKLIREKYLEIRKRISSSRRRVQSGRIFQKLLRSVFFQKADHVALYYGIKPEVETRAFLKNILSSKKLYLPKVNGSKKEIIFCRVESLKKDLIRGGYHLWEPKTGCKKRSSSRMDVIVVPGVAFDRKGRRLGRGGGYYDRVLRQARKVYKIGLCFREQLAPSIPMAAHDQIVNQVITD